VAHVDFGLDDLIRKLDKVKDPATLRAIKKRALARLGMKAVARAKRLTRVDTGYLRRSWFTEPVDDDAVAVENPLHYAPHVNYGHRVGKSNTVYVRGEYMLEKALGQTVKQDLKPELTRATKEILGRFK
jgi:hypothetical protein